MFNYRFTRLFSPLDHEFIEGRNHDLLFSWNSQHGLQSPVWLGLCIPLLSYLATLCILLSTPIPHRPLFSSNSSCAPPLPTSPYSLPSCLQCPFLPPWTLSLKTLLFVCPSAKCYFFQKLNLNFQTKGGPSVLLFQDILCFFLHHFALIAIVWLIPPHSGIRDVLLFHFLSKIKSDSELPTHQCVRRKYQSQSCFCKTVRVQNSEGLWNA